jgi:hypothetical protein
LLPASRLNYASASFIAAATRLGWSAIVARGANVDSATNTSLALIAMYRLNPKWNLIYGAQTTTLDDAIEASPGGVDDTYTVGFVGAAWSF